MRSHKTLARVCAATLLAAAQVQAQDVDLAPEDGDPAEQSQHPRGIYTGVKAGGEESPAIPGAKPGMTPAAVTWPGFQMQPDGGSRVFVQMTARVEVNTALRGNKVLIDFGNATVIGATNRFPLITKYFNTPVTSVELKRENKRLRMELSLRTPLEPRVSTEMAKSGYYFVYVDFPPGSYLGSAPPSQEEGPPAPEGTPTAVAPRPADATQKPPPSHLDADAQSSGQVKAGASARADAELPPGMGKAKASGKAKAGGKAKIGF